MEIASDVCLWIVLILSFIIAYWYLSGPRNLPPGSAGLPVVGYLPFMSKIIHESLQKLGKKYGNVFHLYLGSRLVVVLNDYAAIREAFVNNGQIFAGRPPDNSFSRSTVNNYSFAATDGEYWKQHRTFILKMFKNFGVGKLSLEPQILEEIKHFLDEITKHNGQSFPIKQLLLLTIANNINILLTGKRYDYDHPIMKQQNEIFKKHENSKRQPLLAMFFPWIVRLPASDWLLKTKYYRAFFDEFVNLAEALVQSVKSDYREGEEGNYVHAFMTERNARLRVNSEENIFVEQGLIRITADMLSAGTETTATALQWALLYMTLHPQIQTKVQNEIDHVIGRDREPSYSDRILMPYTEATIMELHRITSLAPLSFPHRNTKDVAIFGHRIPKDTMILSNLYAVHHDPELWGDPQNFRPERFIGPEGQLLQFDHLIPFSIGQRACVGEPLARVEMFLYFVSLLQRFTFVLPDGIEPSLQANIGISRKPKCHVVCAKLR